jgi:hypothetical protein
LRRLKFKYFVCAIAHCARPHSSFIDLNLSHRPPERQWLVRDRIPLRQPTLFTGKGGSGKTLLALQLCAATALDQDWLGSLSEDEARKILEEAGG